jgi:prepilin-type N-terminal cleavage/methylation domain-containing protein
MNTQFPDRSRIRYRPSQGFTLIELMIVVAIVAILTTIAYPNYRDYVIRGQLTDATTSLSALRANLERYYQDNRSYTTVGVFNPPAPCNVAAIADTKFSISCVSTLNTFTATATGLAGSPVAGFTYTVDQTDLQQTVVTTPPAPPSFLGCTTAWVTKTGGC